MYAILKTMSASVKEEPFVRLGNGLGSDGFYTVNHLPVGRRCCKNKDGIPQLCKHFPHHLYAVFHSWFVLRYSVTYVCHTAHQDCKTQCFWVITIKILTSLHCNRRRTQLVNSIIYIEDSDYWNSSYKPSGVVECSGTPGTPTDPLSRGGTQVRLWK